jgi:Domain of unknown function (DUF5671)
MLSLIFLAFLVLAISLNKNNSNNMNNNAKYAFYYLLSLVALIFTAISVGMIAFGIINKTIADALTMRNGVSDSLKFAISALFIATPIFFTMQTLINKGLRSGELDKESGVRRWLTYFILLVSSVTILGVFIGVLNNFLAGEFTISFILKSLSMLIISAAVFSFYFYDIKRANVIDKSLVMRIFFIASLSIIVITFVAAWFFIESPVVTRAKRLDQNLVNNITSLENAVNSYNDKYKKLPENLEEVKNNRDIYLDARSLVDPETNMGIVYHKKGVDTFEFCATFRTDNKNVDPREDATYSDPTKLHLAGYQCIPVTAWGNNNDSKTIEAKPVMIN